MNRYGFALVGAASLALAGCGGSNDDALNNVENMDAVTNLDAQANDAAAEAEALGNQQQQLEQENTPATVDELNASSTTEGEENVSGM